MKRLLTLAAMLVSGIAAFAQDGYVSLPIVKAMGKLVDVGGYVKWTKQETQVGRIKRRKDIVTANYGFFSVSGGTYAPKHR